MVTNHLVKPGLTPVEAVNLLREEFPDVPHWTYLHTGADPDYRGLALMLGATYREEGQFGKWRWLRVNTRYPRVALLGDVLASRKPVVAWIGAIRVTRHDGVSFVVFSYLSHRDEFCHQYLFSTDDHALIKTFITDAVGYHRPKKPRQIRITVVNGPDILLNKVDNETVFLPDETRADIDTQVRAFFEGRRMYEKLGIRHQRGFLFVGPSGTGKTMTIRRLVRMCHRDYKAKFVSLSITTRTDEDTLGAVFTAAARSAPAMVILEDMESLTRDSRITRSAVLAHLDGLKTNKGILIVGTSNAPGSIDPALVHRPSRFDRVWSFPVPDLALRRKYISHHLPEIGAEMAETVAGQTANWSYAYLNELRTTAAVLSIREGHAAVTEKQVRHALALLARQFDAGKKNFLAGATEEGLGFRAA